MPDQETILPDVVDVNETTHSPEYWAAIWDDLQHLMSAKEAAKQLNIADTAISSAIKRLEITPFQFSRGRVYVTPRLVAEWAETYCRIPQGKPLPG